MPAASEPFSDHHAVVSAAVVIIPAECQQLPNLSAIITSFEEACEKALEIVPAASEPFSDHHLGPENA